MTFTTNIANHHKAIFKLSASTLSHLTSKLGNNISAAITFNSCSSSNVVRLVNSLYPTPFILISISNITTSRSSIIRSNTIKLGISNNIRFKSLIRDSSYKTPPTYWFQPFVNIDPVEVLEFATVNPLWEYSVGDPFGLVICRRLTNRGHISSSVVSELTPSVIPEKDWLAKLRRRQLLRGKYVFFFFLIGVSVRHQNIRSHMQARPQENPR